MLHNKKPQLSTEREGAVFVRLCCRAVKPALPLFAAARVLWHRLAGLSNWVAALRGWVQNVGSNTPSTLATRGRHWKTCSKI